MDCVTVKVYTPRVGKEYGEGEIIDWSVVEVWYLGLDHVDVEGLLDRKISINSLFIVCCESCIHVIMLSEFSVYTYIYITYMLSLPTSMTIHNVFNVSLLKKYTHDPNHVIEWIQNRAIGLVKVQWTWYGPKDMTWEHEDVMREEYPHLF